MSLKIIKVHGCSGAGKTTLARELMKHAESVSEIEVDFGKGKLKPEAYVLKLPELNTQLAILGSYRNNCGGMDSYPSNAEEIIKLIEAYRVMGVHILFEGLLLSTYYGGVGKHLEQYGDDFVCAFMDTPLLTCLDRIMHRRDVQKSTNKFDPSKTVEKYNTIEHLKKKCQANGRRVVEIKHNEDLPKQIVHLLGDVH